MTAGEMAISLVLQYTKPATDWQSEALPIGNGRLGAMCFGGAPRERLQLNESSLWTGDEKDAGYYQNLGDLFVELAHGPESDYQRSLDLRTAIHSVSYTADGIGHRREYIASYPQQVLIFRFTADRPGAYNSTVHFVDGHDSPCVADRNGLTASGSLPNGLCFHMQLLVHQTGGTVVGENGVLRINGADNLMIVVAVRTDYSDQRARRWRGAAPGPRVQADLAAAVVLQWEQLRSAHVTDHQALFTRCELELANEPEELSTDQRLAQYNQGKPDPALEALLFHYGRYLLIASSRDALPANLQGLWNESNKPPWRCDYHSNINVQMNYWPAEVCNLSECAVPFIDYVQSLRGVRTEATRNYYLNEVDAAKAPRKSVRGWTVQTENNIFGAGDFKWNPPGSAWYCLHFWEHYDFTRDLEFLRDVAYPVLKEVCEFWEDHLIALPDGRLVTPDGWSPEHGPEEAGVIYDQEIIWNLFENFLRASSALDTDADYRATVVNLRDKLLKPTIGKWGQLMEWMEDRDDAADKHRHVSHLFALHPGDQISVTRTPALAEAARISLTARGDESTGWAMAWRINF
jgi:alpha-L-fucosidase 2